MDISKELETLCKLRADWDWRKNAKDPDFAVEYAQKRYEKQSKKIEDEFERLQRCEERIAELEDAPEKCRRGDE